ncbi:MAG: D-alanyl-D-alanine carboxypeptidase family protein [Clostridia bacterium]
MLKKISCLMFAMLFTVLIIPNLQTKAYELEINSASVLLMEFSTGTVLYSENENEIRACASITKVMTLVLTMEALESGQLNLSDTLYASAHASSMGGSDIWLEEGEAMTVNDLIKATVIMSANDAAVVLAEAIAGSEEAFVDMMNDKAAELGMTNTTFMNCNGLDEEGHLTTAYDIALMSRELMKHELIYDYTTVYIDYLRDGETQLVNTNKLLNSYDGITGLKTGTTSQAGSCIVATASRNEMDIIAVVLGADNMTDRMADATKLLDYGFANWEIVTPLYDLPSEIEVENSMVETIEIYCTGDTSVLAQSTQSDNINCIVKMNDTIIAPLNEDDVLGYIYVQNQDEILKTIEIKAETSAQEITFMKVVIYFFQNFKL